MNTIFWTAVAVIVTAILLAAAVLWLLWVWIDRMATSLEAQARQHQRGRALTIIRSEHNREIVGDGAWNAQPARPRPRTARVRDIEPRGC